MIDENSWINPNIVPFVEKLKNNFQIFRMESFVYFIITTNIDQNLTTENAKLPPYHLFKLSEFEWLGGYKF